MTAHWAIDLHRCLNWFLRPGVSPRNAYIDWDRRVVVYRDPTLRPLCGCDALLIDASHAGSPWFFMPKYVSETRRPDKGCRDDGVVL